VPGGIVVERLVAEEEVDRCVVPPKANLAVARDRCRGFLIARDGIWQGGECGRGFGGRHEHVDVDVAGSAWLERPVGEGDRAAERMRKSGTLETRVELEQLLGK